MQNESSVAHRIQLVTVAQKLFFIRGYESTTIEDIVNEVGVSKDVFYHHFDSKHAIVMGVADLFLATTVSNLQQIVANPSLNAIEKFNAFFQSGQNLSDIEIEQLWASMRILYKQENLRLRYWLEVRQKERITPELTKIIDQGRSEGLFDVANSKYAAGFLLAIGMAAEDTLFAMVTDTGRPENALAMVSEKYSVAQSAMERILAIPAGSFELVDTKTLAKWLAES